MKLLEANKKSVYKELAIHIFCWLCLFLFPLTSTMIELNRIPIEVTIRLLTAPLLFYTNFLFLIPKLLLKKHIFLYIISSISFLIVFNYIMLNLLPNLPFEKFESMIKAQENTPIVSDIRYVMLIIFSLSIFLLGGIISLVIDFYQREKHSKELETNQKEMELQFLRTQLNPHFLFNSLNSIYSLVRSKSNNAPEAVITLSELMRYMLYEVGKDKVLLEKEITYIQNYIALQRLRIKDSEDVKLNIKGDTKNLKIYPLLLIGFIENAFKYGTDYEGKTHIDIRIKIDGKTMNFLIKNYIGIYKKDSESSGIGLNNIKEQLNHLYNHKYILKIENDSGYYVVNLILQL